ncbi:hypothetical protein [Longirhabdus pacifica]|uniref:hypothetical protein n=1 Tax=Longirhabdus pacifica TaxID=2305227 RepID=UPI00100899E5|nr:hypothetical protein [Longirhabdus pacifica]
MHSPLSILNAWKHKKISVQLLTGESTPSPVVNIIVNDVAYCPDGTHIRVYFADKNFIGIPVSAKFTCYNHMIQAKDIDAEIMYLLKQGVDLRDENTNTVHNRQGDANL